VTLGAALLHPITRADVVEISPQVVEASRFFAADNGNALDDPRTHLIQGDGRTHLLLSSRRYDVIISEPSNPWMAGVAALFTREFFTAARDRLAPGGIICQWAHTYDISDADLRSIVGTFASVFPDGTMWLVGESDVLLVSSTGSIEAGLGRLEQGWRNPAVAADLRAVGATGPFSVWSLFVGGPRELTRYGSNALIQTDDRMALEFSAPRAVNAIAAVPGNAATLRTLLDPKQAPQAIRHAMASADAAEWRDRGLMMRQSGEYSVAYDDLRKAVTLAPADVTALDGLLQAAAATHREAEALQFVQSMIRDHRSASSLWIAESQLRVAGGEIDAAIAAAVSASRIDAADPRAWEQLASIFAEIEDVDQLDSAVENLQQLKPGSADAHYYAAGAKFLHHQLAESLSLTERAIAVDPKYTPAYKLLGTVRATLGQVQEARHAYQTAARLSPRDSSIYTNLGLLELTHGNLATAGSYFALALTLNPTSSGAREGLSRALSGRANARSN
jgi:Flp pilus assembly protein TadD